MALLSKLRPRILKAMANQMAWWANFLRAFSGRIYVGTATLLFSKPDPIREHVTASNAHETKRIRSRRWWGHGAQA
jgi:hypothetical protein